MGLGSRGWGSGESAEAVKVAATDAFTTEDEDEEECCFAGFGLSLSYPTEKANIDERARGARARLGLLGLRTVRLLAPPPSFAHCTLSP